MPESDPKHPGDAGWDEQLAKRHDAAEAWLRANLRVAFPIPLSVVKDLYPAGFDVATFQPLLSQVMPGEIAESAERGTDHVFVILKG